ESEISKDVFSVNDDMSLYNEFVTNSLQGLYGVNAQFFPKPPDVDIYGSFAHNHIISPDFLQNFFSFKNLIGIGCQQIQQIKFFLGEQEWLSVLGYFKIIPVYNKVSYFNQFGTVIDLRCQLQQGIYLRDEHFRLDDLYNIIIATGLIACKLRKLFASGRKEYNEGFLQGFALPHFLAGFYTV